MIAQKISTFLFAEWREPIAKAAKLGVFQRKDVISIALFTLLAVGLEVCSVGFVLPLLQYIERGGSIEPLIASSRLWWYLSQSLALVGLRPSLLVLSVLVLVALSARQLVVAVRALLVETVRARVAREMTDRCFQSIMNAKGEYIQRVGSGNFSLLVATQAQSAASIIRNLAEVWSSLLVLGGYIVVLAAIAVVPMLLATVSGVLMILGNNWLVFMARDVSNAFVKEKAGFAQFLVERFNAWRLIKVSNSLPTEIRLSRRYAARLTGMDVRLAKISNLSNLILSLGQALVALVVLNIATGMLGIDLASATLLFLAMFRLMPVINGFSRLRHVNATIHSLLNYVELYVTAAVAEREVDSGQRPVEPLKTQIEFDNVKFQHDSSDWPALSGASLKVPAGKITAITGRSGAGKTTLIDMLPRLIAPTEGVVTFDGVPINEFVLKNLRSAIHYVGQTPLFLNGTVLDNVRYARPDASEDEVLAACRAAYAHEFIKLMPDGYQTEIGEGGGRLSGGQKQRLAIARAFLSHASIIILDEPTSSLDYESESKISKALRMLADERGATILIVTHHASTMRNVDVVALMESGKVVACGPPAQLALDDEWFAALTKTPAREESRPAPEVGTGS